MASRHVFCDGQVAWAFLENHGDSDLLPAKGDDKLRLAVLITASGLQGEQPLVDRTM